MRAPRRVASWPIVHVLGSGPSLPRGAASRPIARLTSRVSVADFPWARKAHQSSRTKAPGREPPSLPSYVTRRLPPADGSPAFWKSTGLLLSITLALLVVDFVYRPQRPLLEAQRPEDTSDKPTQRDQDWEWIWTPFSEDLEEYEADANENLRLLYRETREAIAREDWSAARRALLSAWRATDGLEADDRFDEFGPGFLLPLFNMFFLPRLSGNDPIDFSTAVSLAQEILPVVDEARNKPGVERESPYWLDLLRVSMQLRVKTGRQILQRQKERNSPWAGRDSPMSANGVVVSAESILQPPREEFVALMEDIRARGHNPFDEDLNDIVDDYWSLNYDIANRNDQYVDAIKFAQYSCIIGNNEILPEENCDRLYRLGDAIITYSDIKKENGSKTNPAVERIRPEFKDFKKVIKMPSDQLAAGSKKELISASQQLANMCLRWSNQIETSPRREVAQMEACMLAAEVCYAKNDPAQCDSYMQRAESLAEALVKPKADKSLLRSVRRLRTWYWAIRAKDSRDEHWSSNDGVGRLNLGS